MVKINYQTCNYLCILYGGECQPLDESAQHNFMGGGGNRCNRAGWYWVCCERLRCKSDGEGEGATEKEMGRTEEEEEEEKEKDRRKLSTILQTNKLVR